MKYRTSQRYCSCSAQASGSVRPGGSRGQIGVDRQNGDTLNVRCAILRGAGSRPPLPPPRRRRGATTHRRKDVDAAEVETALRSIPDLREVLATASPEELAEILDAFDLKASYDRRDHSLEITVTVVPELWSEDVPDAVRPATRAGRRNPSIDLIESLSHVEVSDRLERLSHRDWCPVARRRQAAGPTGPSKRKFGTVGDAVVRVLAEAGSELRVMEVQLGVEQLLGGPVARSSVKNYLKRGSERRHPLFERVGRGRYRLLTPEQV